MLLLAIAGGAVLHELWQSPPPSTTTVDASIPNRPDELARIDGGFTWTATRGGNALFELIAASGVVVEGGVEFLREIDSLRVHLKDGGWVTLHAPAGRIEGRGDEAEGKGLRLFLEGGVTAEDPSGAVLSAEALSYDFSTNLLATSGPAQLTRLNTKTFVAAFDYDTSTKRLVTHGSVRMELGGLALYTVETTDAIYQLESGDVEFTRPVHVIRAADALEIVAWRGRAQLTKTGRGQTFTLDGPLLIDQRSPDGAWSVAGSRLESVSSSELGSLTVHGPIACLLETRGSSGVQRGELRTRLLQIEPMAGKGYVATASNGFEAQLDSDGSADRVEFAGDEARLMAPASTLQSLLATGHIQIKAQNGAAAEGSGLQWNASAAHLIGLDGSPARATQKRDSVEAPRLLFDRKLATLVADGPVTTQVTVGSSTTGAIFKSGEALSIRSQRLTMPQRDGWTVFEGPVQAWQEAAKLQAKTLRYDREKEKLEAEGDVRITRNIPGDDGSIRNVRLSAQSLSYDAPTREVRLDGDAHYQEEPGIRLASSSMIVHLGEQESVESLSATGNVKLDARGTRGTADRLEWTGGTKGVALLFGTNSFATLQATDGPPMRGQRLRYDLKTQQFTADGGSGKTVIEGITPPPSSEKKP